MDSLTVKTPKSSVANPISTVRTANSTGLESIDFQQMLSNILMSSGLNGSSGTSAASSTGSSGDLSMLGSSSSNMMMPMMFVMLEQLLMKQMEMLQAGKLSSTTAADANPNSQTQSTELRQPAILQANQTRAAAAAAAAGVNQPASASQVVPKVNPPATNTAVPVSSTSVIPGTHATPYGEPVHGPLTQGYNSHHNGLDIGIVTGTPVHTSMDGKVIYAGWSPIGYGNLVIVQNGDYQTYYAHLSKVPVAVDQTVQAGTTIGLSGSTGNSTGPHLHYEIRYKGKNIDPTSLTLNKSI